MKLKLRGKSASSDSLLFLDDRSKRAAISIPFVVWIPALLVVCYGAAALGAITNKQIVSDFPFPVVLSASHLISGALIDYIGLRSKGVPIPFNRRTVLSALPTGLALAFSKTLTFVSYGMVPASLTHTIKSSSPVFNVLLAKLAYGRLPSRLTCLSLLPISIGVTISALNEIDLRFLGFVAALLSCLANVSHAMYTKSVIRSQLCGPVILHMYTSILAALFLLPYALFKDVPAIWRACYPAAALPIPNIDGVPLSAAVPDLSNAALTAAAAAAATTVPVAAFVLSNVLHYIQNMTGLVVLIRVSSLTYQVANTLKRATIIIFSVLYFRNPVSWLNWCGMCIALFGFFCYGYSRSITDSDVKKPPPSANKLREQESQSTPLYPLPFIRLLPQSSKLPVALSKKTDNLPSSHRPNRVRRQSSRDIHAATADEHQHNVANFVALHHRSHASPSPPPPYQDHPSDELSFLPSASSTFIATSSSSFSPLPSVASHSSYPVSPPPRSLPLHLSTPLVSGDALSVPAAAAYPPPAPLAPPALPVMPPALPLHMTMTSTPSLPPPTPSHHLHHHHHVHHHLVTFVAPSPGASTHAIPTAPPPHSFNNALFPSTAKVVPLDSNSNVSPSLSSTPSHPDSHPPSISISDQHGPKI